VGREKVVGILGGMGPYATIDMFRRIVDLTPARKDWEHLRIIVDNHPKIPSRSRAILYGETSPAPMMIETAANLARAGADFIVIPCNTAHHFLDEVKQGSPIPIVSIIEETRDYVMQRMPKVRCVGLLAGTVTASGTLYQDAFADRGVSVIAPAGDEQDRVEEVKEAIKLGDTGADVRATLIAAASKLAAAGAEALIIGCTELSIIAAQDDFPVPIYDSNDILAQAAVDTALGRR